MILHAGLIACRVRCRWLGALVLGDSGSGKSDLILRALGLGFRLVADDRTVVWTSGGRLFGRAPDALAGLIEVRGVGILRQPDLRLAEVGLLARCLLPGEAPPRMPDEEDEELAGVRLPALRLSALEPSAPAKLGRAVMRLGQGAGAA